jgi:radical SAM protein with 4Fe4S-binding SPASM domain
LDELNSLFSDLSKLKVFHVSLTGGEPLLRPDLFDVIDLGRGYGLEIGITTNGTLIDEVVATRIKNSGVWGVRVSLDSSARDLNDQFRGETGAFDKTCSGIRWLVKHEIPVVILTVVSKFNYDSWEDMIPLCRSLGVRALNTYSFVPGGRGKTRTDLSLTPQEYRDFLLKINKYQTVNKSDVKIISECPLLCVVREEKHSGACPAGIFDLLIKEDGEVNPCPYFDISLGNAKHNSIGDIWQQSKFLHDLRNVDCLAEACKKCDFVSSCFGGCRAAAFSTYENICTADPYCWIAEIK